MRKSSLKDIQLLPSLLDRVSDDSYLNTTLEQSKQRVKTLEQQLLTQADEVDETTKKTWIKELQTQRSQFDYLQRSVGSLDKITDCVKRDLSWLFNSQNLCLDQEQEEAFPNVASSVLNYGMPDLTGRAAPTIKTAHLEKALTQIILRFEPRIIAKTLRVTLHEDDSQMDHNALVFKISGDLWTEPVPIHLQLMTQLDLDSGKVDVNDFP